MTQPEPKTPFQQTVEKIKDVFSQYAVEDIANSLFVSCIWLPNVASPIQHQLLIAVLVSMKPEEFTSRVRIDTYKNFHEFLEQLFPLIPSFHLQEDYVPSPDWGSVKYHFEEDDFKIFYGTELENLYDYLQLFEIIYGSYNDEFLQLTGRSPNEELYGALILQNKIISSLKGQPSKEKLKDISPGYKEIPTEDFWKEARSFYSSFSPQELIQRSFLEQYSQEIGQPILALASEQLVQESIFEGRLLPFIFLRWQERFFLVLPRRISDVLLQDWSNIFAKFRDDILENTNRYFTHWSGSVYKYLKLRIRKDHLHGVTNAIDVKGQHHEIIFAASILTKNKLILVYVAEPFTKEEEIAKNLEAVTPKLVESLELIRRAPVTLSLNLEKQNVQFESKKDGETLEPLLIVVLPQATFQPVRIKRPPALAAEFIFLDQFLGVFDELDDPNELIAFLDYVEELQDIIQIPFTSTLDYFASYKDSHGILISGARKPDFIVLEPHWGSDMRYESLSEFWSLYPDIGFFDHPRSWKPIKETATRVRLEARAYFGSALYTEIGKTRIFISAPFEYLTYEQGLVTDTLMQSLEDSLSRLKSYFENHKFFQKYERLQVIFLPSILSENENFKHILHLKPEGVFWRSDGGHPRRDWPGIRIVIDTDALLDALEKTADNNIEIDLLLEILNHMNVFVPDSGIDQIVQNVNKERGKLPRFTAFHRDKEVSFPEFVPVHKPEIHDFKKARNKIAEIAVSLGIRTGDYELEPAKDILNRLRRSVIFAVENEVVKFNFDLCIPYLIERIDAFEDEHERNRLYLHQSLKHEVDFERDERYSSERQEFLRHHKNFRYLIEKFVQLRPNGSKKLTPDEFQYLAALVDQLLNIYFASDSLHYQIYPVGITITDDYLINVNYGADLEAKQEAFGREQAKISLGEIGVEADRVETSGSLDEYLNDLDEAFKNDLGFTLRNLTAVLHVLSQWAGYDGNSKLSAFYTVAEETLVTICLKSAIDLKADEAKRIVKFLTLRSKDVVRISGQAQPCDDIPVWEYRKRYSRYTLRPLIVLGGQYCWGAYSAKRSGIMWSHVPLDHSLPADLSTPSVDRVLQIKHRLIEQEVEGKVLEIVKRFTPYAESNVYLHQRDKEGKHPPELGDYDILALLSEKNIILNIECKEISPAFCAKDSKRIKEKIFGRFEKEKGYLVKVENREDYLRKNIERIFRVMGFPSIPPDTVQIVSLFVSRDLYWWMKNPVRPTNVVFLRTDLLAGYIDQLLE